MEEATLISDHHCITIDIQGITTCRENSQIQPGMNYSIITWDYFLKDAEKIEVN
jgi:hypothetical protein